MSAEQDIFEIILAVKDDEAQQAKRTLEQLADAGRQLKADLDAARITNDQYRAGLANLATDASNARTKLSALNDEMRDLARQSGGKGPRLEGTDRTAAKAQLGLLTANTLQDMIQGGPASGINNILGALGNGKIRALAGEFVEAAGGATGLASKLGAIGAAALTAFELVDAGLKSAKLEWSDLDDLAANTAPLQATKETLVGIGEIMGQLAKDYHLDAAFEGATGAATGYLHSLAEAVLGWDEATEAARRHKEEVARGVQAARDYIGAVKALASFRSDEQEEKTKRGKLVGEQLADLGKEGGIDAVIDKLARQATAKGGDDKVDWYNLDEKGQPTGEPEKITRREKARRELTSDFGKAAQGDAAALDRLRPQLGRAGYDTGKLDAAAQGRDVDKEAAAEAKANQKAIDDGAKLADAALKDFAHSLDETAKANKEAVAEARRSRSFLTKPAADLSDAEREAKGEHDAREAKVKEALRSRSFLDESFQVKDDDNLTPEQQEAARRYRRTAESFRASSSRGGDHSQVFNDAKSIRDAIQQSVRAPERNPTFDEMLRALNEQPPLLKKISEWKVFDGIARLG